MSKVSATNTKAEILQAYKDLLEKLKESQKEDPKVQKKTKEKEEVLERVEGISLENVLTGLGGVKLQIAQALESIETKMTEKVKTLENLERSIKIRADELEEIHGIQVQAESLTALQRTYSQFQEDFERRKKEQNEGLESEILESRALWEKERVEAISQKKEREDLEKKQRQREKEEYDYQLKKERQREEDDYANRKESLEKELVMMQAEAEQKFRQREELVSQREKTVDALQEEVDTFANRLSQAVEEAESRVKERLILDYESRMALREKEVEGQLRLQEQMIQSLELKIKEQSHYIEQLTKEAKDAGKQAQTIAIRAIDSSTGRLRQGDIFRERESVEARESSDL